MSGSNVWGLIAGEFKPEPNFNATQDERGGWRATQSYLCLESSIDTGAFRLNFASNQSPTVLDASLPAFWSFLGLVGVNVRNEAGGLSRVEAEFSGFWASGVGGGDAEDPVYELRGEGTVMRSILEHPTVKDFGDVDRELLAEVYRGNAIWNGTTLRTGRVLGANGTWLQEDYPTQPSNATVERWCGIVQSTQSYEASRYTWTKRWQDDDGITAASLNKLGKIDVPDNDPVQPNADYDWRLTSANQTQQGELYDNMLEWTLSEEGKWDQDLYNF